eukprot:TRINITY_DN5817_c0_g1_i1.p1 TRINITY_DN5817_c0_g1~~TRINITY_DN5817_c0_g1_i1.p1  ORF type:complete len:328 (+),score=98.82 TRINITY_DN5817_c0_g1_i1:145-984(+)
MKHVKQVEKRKARTKRQKEREELGDKAPPAEVPKTLENLREADVTVVDEADEEVLRDEAEDEFRNYFNAGKPPKILLTSSLAPSKPTHQFISELMQIIPNSEYYKRKNYEVKQIVEYACNREYTAIIITNEDKKKLNGLWIISLPEGPTAFFKLSSVKLSAKIKNHGRPSTHLPEIILNSFSTRLGHSVARMLASLFPQSPQFRGRRVVTFHNQRDFIFVRHHRYIFEEEGKKARLQEIGPRFTLKLRSLQKGTFDTKHGEYEWLHKPELDTSRRRFFL